MNAPENHLKLDAWRGFKTGEWQDKVDTRGFIQLNYTPYLADDSFLAGPTERTTQLWTELSVQLKEERKRGVLEVSTHVGASITAHGPGYINKDLETIVGVQTDKPLRRAIMPNGGLRMVQNGLEAYHFEMNPQIVDIFSKYRKDHNMGVFDAYTPEIMACRSSGVITGLPDSYGRGRIIGDYRRVALYGVDFLIVDKKREKTELNDVPFTESVIRLREELSEQIKALGELKQMAKSYGFDISKPATTAQEAIQWLYFGYLAATKEQNGAAMSIGRTSTFLDVYIERDLIEGRITESEAQEMIDHMVMKLRIIRFLRTPEYDDLFSGDPTWVTESIGGTGLDGRTLVTKSSFRVLHTLYNLGPAPEPNLTVLWSTSFPQGFKEFCAKVSIDTSAIQYENDDLMNPKWGDDYAIACCVSAMAVGKQMQFFGARVNLAKAMLYAINGGVDEKTGKVVANGFEPLKGDVLNYDEVMAKYDVMLDWLAKTYVTALNSIHYMHDKYSYERIEMALHDRDILRTMACGIAGLAVAADSLSAIKHAKVSVIRNEKGIAVDYKIEGDYPAYGNNDDRVDDIAVWLTTTFMNKIKAQPVFYRDSMPTQSVLTITSNVVYGKKTGNTPDGRRSGTPFSPGANPMNGRDTNGFIAAGFSVSKIPYESALDGVSWTASMTPDALGHNDADRVKTLAASIDGLFGPHGEECSTCLDKDAVDQTMDQLFHLNMNVLNRDTLLDAMEHPENYPQLTVRVSGYAVNFVKLTREQQMDVISRTFHGKC
ncbi:formate C-acetyltransferase [Iodobacter sp. CM08]|uniref:formate C-acetyltransferase n=1 Tax=Iodobacter sp. CM08 TaxID=3085902 RepID=UPI002980DD73|nr:formate C-acetyltransferase [Iodobacter sp. CM08]MDW5418479.1 formate C-acetyltransferase [Iodobacter sp. CM08]